MGRRVCGVRVRVEISTHQGRSSRPPSDRGRPRYGSDRYRGRGYDDYDDRYSRRYVQCILDLHVQDFECKPFKDPKFFNSQKGNVSFAIMIIPTINFS